GEKIAVVGLNGAGKTTLIKLLCRLYQPQKGRILVNGRNIQDYNYESYMRQVAAVFQDYRLFDFSIEENISCRAPGQDESTVQKLVAQVGLAEKLKDLPEGMHTLLGKAYDEEGTELSGGQQQKVAIARALYKNASLIILDEPTSALDPLAEAEIYENFNELTGGKTAIYISHRMSSSVFCNKVLVIDQGRIADYDRHDQLMKKEGGLYRRMFEAQAENYA
ncbi:MAG: ABC transporter ATP-binding protein/permease, partial [Acetatifactor sp.]|nr:ABC transporter ATP-binding protein/permease [Acetatifactor sp.]